VAEASAPHLERLRALSWASFSFTLPLGWEITGYHFGERTGRFQFHRRTEPRGELAWREVKGTPDQPRIMTEVHRRWLAAEFPAEAAAFTGLTLTRIGDVTLGVHRPGAPALASLFQPATRTLLQWVFPAWDPGLSASELEPLLAASRANAEPARRWELFGLRLRLPETFLFEELKPLPANVKLVFETRKNLRLTARRMGLDREVLSTVDLGGLHRRLLGKDGARVRRSAAAEVLGCPGARCEFERRGESRMETLTGRWHQGEGLIWHDAAEGRIYALEQLGPAKQPRLALDEVCLRGEAPAHG
jgi:hypothetical protein